MAFAFSRLREVERRERERTYTMMSTENQMGKRNGKWGYIGAVYHSKKQPGLDADVAASLPRRLRHALCLGMTCKAKENGNNPIWGLGK